MKKTFFTISIFLLFTFFGFSQKGNNDKIKSYKIAYLTEVLDLSSKEAQKFWPIYNSYSENERKLKIGQARKFRKQIREIGGIDALSDTEASEMLSARIDIEERLHKLKRQLISDLKPVISTKKILKLLHAENEFNRKLLKKIREKKRP